MLVCVIILIFWTNVIFAQEGRISMNINNRGGIVNVDFCGYGEKWWGRYGGRVTAGYEYQVLNFENNFLIQTTFCYRTKYGNFILSPFYFYWNSETKRHITPLMAAYEREWPEARVSVGIDNSHGIKPYISFQKNIFKIESIKIKARPN